MIPIPIVFVIYAKYNLLCLPFCEGKYIYIYTPFTEPINPSMGEDCYTVCKALHTQTPNFVFHQYYLPWGLSLWLQTPGRTATVFPETAVSPLRFGQTYWQPVSVHPESLILSPDTKRLPVTQPQGYLYVGKSGQANHIYKQAKPVHWLEYRLLWFLQAPCPQRWHSPPERQDYKSPGPAINSVY